MLVNLLSKKRRAIVAGPPSQYIVTASTYTPGPAASVTITAQLADANGRSVHTAGRTVTWTKSNPSGSFSSGTSVTDASGVATVTLTTSATPGATTTVTGTDAGPFAGTSSTITVIAPTATSYQVTAADYAPIAGASDVITAQLLDQYGAALAEAGHTVTWSKSVTGGSFSGGTSTTNGSGIATVTLTAPAAGVATTVTATDEGLRTGTTPTITPVAAPPAATDYAVTAADYNPVGGANQTITAQLRDQYGAPFASAGHTVTWTKSNAGGSFSSGTSTTDASGIATVTLTAPAAGITFTVTATDEGARTGTSSNIVTQSDHAALIATVNGYAGGQLLFYTTTRPASAGDSPTGCTLLATWDIDATTPIDPVTLKLNLVGSPNYIIASGTVDWVRMVKSDGSGATDANVRTGAATNTIVGNTLTFTISNTLTDVSIGAIES